VDPGGPATGYFRNCISLRQVSVTLRYRYAGYGAVLYTSYTFERAEDAQISGGLYSTDHSDRSLRATYSPYRPERAEDARISGGLWEIWSDIGAYIFFWGSYAGSVGVIARD
jgi:hypothetical protein